MTVVLVKPVRKEQRAQKASAIVLGTHNDRHSIASCCSPWVHRGTCLGPVLAREQLRCWDVDPLKIKGRGKNRKERVFSPLTGPTLCCDFLQLWPGEENPSRNGYGKPGSEALAAEQREQAGEKSPALTALSYFAGAADKTGTRENQVGWGSLSFWGGGMASGLGSPWSLLSMKFHEALFYVALEVLRFSLAATAEVRIEKLCPKNVPLAKGTQSCLDHSTHSMSDRRSLQPCSVVYGNYLPVHLGLWLPSHPRYLKGTQTAWTLELRRLRVCP